MHRELRRKTVTYGVAAVLLAIVLSAVCYHLGTEIVRLQPTQPITRQTPLKTFSSYEELRDFLMTRMEKISYWGVEERTLLPSVPAPAELATAVGTLDYSKTNIQVEGVDEADIVKTDGEYAYVVSGNRLIILKAYPPEEATILSQISFDGTPMEVFINQDKLAVFESPMEIRPLYVSPPEEVASVISPVPPPLKDLTSIKVYDVSDKASPVLARNVTVDGYYFNSRMIGDYVYMVVNQPAIQPIVVTEDEVKVEVNLPKFYFGDASRKIRASEIYYSNASDDIFHAFTTIVGINIQNDELPPAYKTFLLGSASCMYVSLDNIYITFTKEGGKTLIYRIIIEDDEIECVAEGEVAGYVLNQFSMDEYDDHFRIATTTWEGPASQNNIYILNMNLTTVGRLENLAPEEQIYSARFMGDRCYLVTFRQVDPFFVIDLKDPENPEVLGFLKIPGYSSYLHPYDEDHIIGIGKEDTNLKISLFDVSDVSDPEEVGKYTVGDKGSWSDSPILWDHKALLFDRSRNLLVIPVSTESVVKGQYTAWQGAYVFNISLSGIMLKGDITHFEDAESQGDYYVKRSFYIDHVLYTISDKKIKMNDLENLQPINEVKLH